MDQPDRESLTQWALDRIQYHEAETDRYRQVLAALRGVEPEPIGRSSAPWSTVAGFGPDGLAVGSRQQQSLAALYTAAAPMQTSAVDKRTLSPQEPNTHQALHKLKARGGVRMVSDNPQRWELTPKWRQWMESQQE
jgi:hypothetical protein